MKCSCGKEYSQQEWEDLSYVGVMGDDEETLELRNCHCRSTIAIALEIAEIQRDEDLLIYAMEKAS